MELQLIVAIIRNEELENIESRLKNMRVKGITVTEVKGFGEYTNYFSADRMATHTRIEIFTKETRVEEIVTAIMDVAHTNFPGDGIVAVLPVEKLYSIRTKSKIQSDKI